MESESDKKIKVKVGYSVKVSFQSREQVLPMMIRLFKKVKVKIKTRKSKIRYSIKAKWEREPVVNGKIYERRSICGNSSIFLQCEASWPQVVFCPLETDPQ